MEGQQRTDTSAFTYEANGLRWYVYDGLGSVLAEVDGSGNIQMCRTYDAYGSVRRQDANPNHTSKSNHRFVGALGHMSEGETGYTYMRARYYDPAIGRFISEDPARNGVNWFVYCGNDPVGSVDADGKVRVPRNKADALLVALQAVATAAAFLGLQLDVNDRLQHALTGIASITDAIGVWKAGDTVYALSFGMACALAVGVNIGAGIVMEGVGRSLNNGMKLTSVVMVLYGMNQIYISIAASDSMER